MAQHPKNLTTEADIDAALERAELFDRFPRIVGVLIHPDLAVDDLVLGLDTGQRIPVSREDFPFLRKATYEQLMDFTVGPNGRDVWWNQLDDGIYLPSLLDHRAQKAA